MVMPSRPDRAPTQPHRAATRSVAALAPLALVLGLVAAACGGGSSKPSATTAAPTTSTSAAAAAGGGGGRGALNSQLAAFRTCMATQGEPLPTFAPRPTTTLAPGETPSTDAGGGGRRGFGGGFGFGGGGAGGGLGVFLRGLNQNDPKVMAAYNACKGQIPASLLQQQQQRQQALSAFVSCMKDHGVTITTGAPTPGTTPSTIDQTSTAYQTCKVLLPNGGAFGPGASSTTTTP